MRQRLRPLVVLLAALGSTAVVAADWQTVASDKKRTIELDRASILQSDPGTKVAWGRIVLSEDESAAAGYAAVKALNRYDCKNRTFATVKRVYLDADSGVLKDEKVKVEKDMPVAAGSVDERLWRDVCQPTGKGAPELAALAKNAGKAAQTAQAATPKAELRSADYRPAKGADKPAQVRVAEHGAEPAAEAPVPIKKNFIDKPAPPPKADSHAAEKAPEKPAEKVIEKPAPPVHAEAPPEVRRVPAYVPPPPRPKPRPVKMAPVKVEAQAAHGPAAAGTPLAHHEIHWGYEGEGAPANWGVLKPDWQLCSSGERQSPIDIRDGVKVDLEPIRFDYKTTQFRIVDNGHTIQVNVAPGSTLQVMGRYYDLVQFHFHRPSEERINGKGFEMVVHLVHKDLDGRIAVLAVLLERGQTPHPLVQTLWNNLPLEKNADYAPEGVSIDLNQLLPAERNYYTYMGSLTTPPCSEGVLWMVMKQPAQLSAEQIAIFARMYPMNARPVQAIKGRMIKESR